MENQKDKHTQSLNTIQKLQNMEKQLYESLKENASRGENIKQQTSIIESINQMSNTRIQLFEQLQSYYNMAEENLDETKKDLFDEILILKMTEQQMNQSKKNMKELTQKNNSNLRMVEINTYYGKQYMDQISLIQLVILVCLPLIVFGVLYKMDILPIYITSVLVFLVIVVGTLFIGRKVNDMISRSNMNYDEYDWKFDPNTQKPSVYEYDMNQLGLSSDKDKADSHDMTSLEKRLGLGCVGENCCSSNMTFDVSSNKCIDKKETKQEKHDKKENKKENFDIGSLTIGSFHIPKMGSKLNVGSDSNSIHSYDSTEQRYASV